MARHAVVDLCNVFRLTPTRPPVERLPPAEAARLERFVATAGVKLRTDEAAVAKFAALRAMYEPYAQALASFLVMPLPPWVPSEGTTSETWHTIG